MRRRLATAIAVVLALVPVAATLSSCGSGNGQLRVTMSSSDQAQTYSDCAKKPATAPCYKPGDHATLSVKVANRGPGSVTGVTVHVTLPSSFRYRSTEGVESFGATRTQPLDAAVNTVTPIFGLWTLDPPAADGTVAFVTITLIADVQGRPGGPAVQAFAAGDASAGNTDAAPFVLQVIAAPHLAALVSVSPTSARAAGTVTYQVRITNDGTGVATNVAVLVTLPPTLTFVDSVIPFPGNGTRNRGVNPFRNTLLVYYDGFVLPALSNGGPGFVVILFKAAVATGAPPGSYPVDASVTDDAGDSTSLHAVAALTIS